MKLTIPNQGLVFWPVGTGDSTTIRITETHFMQVDLHHMEQAEDGSESAWPVVDELLEILPTRRGRPYLSAFVLTHPDEDHCKGFARLNEKALISELWMCADSFHGPIANLCDDAKAFVQQAKRRIDKTIEARGDPGPGHRIRVIGSDRVVEPLRPRGFPGDLLSMPTDTITTLDGADLAGTFSVCLHAPIGSESGEGRNDRSLAFQVALENGPATGKALFLGDLAYSAVRRIFDCGDPRTREWDVMLASHHCSKSAMFVKDEQSGRERLRGDIMRDIARAARRPAYVVSSSRPVPASNGPGDDPPHAKAKALYKRIPGSEFLCTHEHPNAQSPEPVMFEVGTSGFRRFQPHRPSKSLGSLLESARGSTRPPAVPIGFGCDDE